MKEWKVTSEESGTKLQPFLKNKMGAAFSARQLKKAIDNNCCLVNGKPQRFATFMVGRGDVVTLHIEELASPAQNSLRFEKERILFEDSFLLIYNKPSGISSESQELLKALESHVPKLELVHRLDRDTTGALIFAKTQLIREAMISLFRKHQIKKTYLALVDGVPSVREGVVENFLGKIHAYEGQVLWGEVSKEKGLHAKTIWRSERFGKDAALITCHPVTGRTHQIRVHLNGLGHPILGDFQYGKKFRCPYHPPRCLLHASELAFVHPLSSQELIVKAPLPSDFLETMKRVLS
jgi:RluA family pseudouridine synthase